MINFIETIIGGKIELQKILFGNALNLDWSKILLFCKGLTVKAQNPGFVNKVDLQALY